MGRGRKPIATPTSEVEKLPTKVLVVDKKEFDTAKLPVAITEPVIVAPPRSTMRPFLTLNSFGIIFTFHFPG